MLLLKRYITRFVLVATVVVLLIVAALSFVIGLLGELHEIGVGEYGLFQAILFSLMRLPNILYQFFPMLMLLGGVIGLGVLAAHHELTVMRVYGYTRRRIAGAVCTAAVIAIFIVTLVGELIAPIGIYTAEAHKATAQSRGQAVATLSGVWIHEGNNFLHINRVIDYTDLAGVTRYEFASDHHLLAAYYAKTLRFVDKQWVGDDVVKTTLSENGARSEFYPNASWGLHFNPSILNIGIVEPQSLSLYKLWNYSHYLKQNHLQASRFQFEFWQRIFQPLTTLVMVLLAVPFVFVGPRSVMLGRRIMAAVMLSFIFYILNAFLGQFIIVFQFPPMFAALLPTLVFAGVSAIWFWKAV